MVNVQCSHLFAALLLVSIAFVQSIPTSVLVDTKESQPSETQQPKSTESPATVGRGNPIKSKLEEPKLHAQKRGVKQNYFEPVIPNDILFNNLPNGVWDNGAGNTLYPDLQELDDYPPIYPPAVLNTPYHQRDYTTLPQILSPPDNYYDEPYALPVSVPKYPYPRYFDDRKKRSPLNKNALRWKREAARLNTADVLALLSYLEDQQRNRYGYENEDLSPLEYPKAIYHSPYAADIDLNNDNAGMGGEWWNENIEPSVQYNANPFERFEPSALNRFTPKVNSATKFMINKKKRSLNLHAGDALKPRSLGAKLGGASEHHFNGPESRF